VFLFVGMVVFFGSNQTGALLAIAALSGSMLVSYARARGESLGINCSGGLMQRGERLVLLCLLCLTDRVISARLQRPTGTALMAGAGLIAAASFYTAVYRTVWIARRLRDNER